MATHGVPCEYDVQQVTSLRCQVSFDQAGERQVQIINASHFPTSTISNARTTPRRPKFVLREEEVSAEGLHCSVRKHARLGCAVVNFKSESLREAVKLYLQHNSEEEVAAWQRSDVALIVQAHFDKATNEYDRTGLYVTWGREAEKTLPIPVQFLRERFDLIVSNILMRSYSAPPPDEVPRSRFC
eukprot:TRINITY_DN8822_c0_g1_i3.p1 TRINITY_DN8822_c0_g1~~TRINITY_DN8822_c0_g1_i3.p1  ORF type:complete len:185 (-),score=24.66 TRINITY_DN8822_c0_g1_i3:235-789(-)